MAPHCHVLGIDFGTSNSAAGFLCEGKPQLIELAPGSTTLPTTLFFDFETRQTLIGEPANRALLDGVDGRFMRALKRVLGKHDRSTVHLTGSAVGKVQLPSRTCCSGRQRRGV